jgi:hypoxanthine phosphoribosyltransferase
MKVEIVDVMFDEATIAGKVKELADRISRDYEGKDLVLVCILKGAVTFTADLMRKLQVPSTIEFVQASSYGMATDSSRLITVKKDLDTDIAGRHVLLVDCIIDTGDTLAHLMKAFGERKPASLEAVTLLDKKPRRRVPVNVKYVGFEIPDKFVVGYGMDCAQQYRYLPYVAVVRTDKP